jgi:A/G-specific adenine glycosylase
VGAYTAAAVASIAFDRPANVVDGNVERVMARVFAVETPLPAARPELKRLAAGFVTDDRPGDWAQALMDLGAGVCRPKSPTCDRCPVSAFCQGLKTGAPERFPVKAAKAARPERTGVAWVALDDQGRVGLVRRPDKGLLGGMTGLPTAGWGGGDDPAPGPGPWRAAGAATHVFTHFGLTLEVLVGLGEGDLIWTEPEAARRTLPTVFRKALERGMA